MMKRLLGRNRALALLSLALASLPIQAQTTPASTRSAGPYTYDITQEVTLGGTVSTVLTKPSRGMIAGSHLLLTTASGPVDVSLGTFGLKGDGALSVAAGQHVLVTGVMKTLKNQQFFVARTVKVGEEVYAIRNRHGIPVSPQARQRAIGNAAQNGETL
jgi:hypothetical protein